MATLKEQLAIVAKEYARQTGEIIGYRPEYWVAGDCCIDVCSFGDNFFLSLAEMQEIVDHLPKWIERYGSRDEVGEEVVRWLRWSCDDNVDEYGEWRNRPRINLWSWLKGLRPEMLKWDDTDEFFKLKHQLSILKEVEEVYPSASVENAIKQITARVNHIDEQLKAEAEKYMKESPHYQEFLKTVEEYEKEQL